MSALQNRRGTAARWAFVNPVLALAEIGFETDTNQIKIGDGVTNWNSLAYFASVGVIFSFVVAGNIPAFAAVTSTGLAANSATTAHFGKVIGVTLAAIASGFSGLVQVAGQLTNPAWAWSTGDLIFLNGASLSSSPPGTGFVQPLGTAKSATTIILEIGTPILL